MFLINDSKPTEFRVFIKNPKKVRLIKGSKPENRTDYYIPVQNALYGIKFRGKKSSFRLEVKIGAKQKNGHNTWRKIRCGDKYIQIIMDKHPGFVKGKPTSRALEELEKNCGSDVFQSAVATLSTFKTEFKDTKSSKPHFPVVRVKKERLQKFGMRVTKEDTDVEFHWYKGGVQHRVHYTSIAIEGKLTETDRTQLLENINSMNYEGSPIIADYPKMLLHLYGKA